MAVLTLHDKNAQSVTGLNLGNFIDLSTEQIRLFEQKDPDPAFVSMEEIIARIPGAVLAINTGEPIPVWVYNLSDRDLDESIDPSAFPDEQRAFDLTTYDNAGGDKPINDPTVEFLPMDLDNEDVNIAVGARFALRFEDPGAGEHRYFRVLIHSTDDTNGYAFRGARTVLQFEELVENRVLVPIAIVEQRDGFVISSPKDLHHRVSANVGDLVWSLRPRDHDFVGPDTYDRAFPVATVAFQKWVEGRRWQNYVWGAPDAHPPNWVDSVVQRTITSRSYLNSTYAIKINHGERPRQDDPNTTHVSKAGSDRTFSRYKYNLYFVDGSDLDVQDWDPTVDVEDEM